MTVELLHIDCMEYMRGLPNNTFDLCITSPPYNMNLRINSKGDGYCSRQIVKELSTKYEGYDDNLAMEDYRLFLSDFITEACRVSKIVFLNIQCITGNKPALFSALGKHSHLVKEVIIWDKTKAQPAIGEGVLNSEFEFIYVLGGNPIARRFYDSGFNRGTVSNLWKIPSDHRAVANHGAGFPLAIPEKILSLFNDSVKTVFDPFVGTGTTAISAHYAKKDFTGCEISKDYYDAALLRIKHETKQVGLF